MRSSKSSKVEQGSLPWDPVGLMAGVDEAGRGPLAGPVVAAAVILDDSRRIRGLADSKQLTPLAARSPVRPDLREGAVPVHRPGHGRGDRPLNIFHATMLAMKRAVEGLRLKPAKVLVDGNALPASKCWPRPSSAATPRSSRSRRRPSWPRCTRDRLLQQLHEEFPQYGFAAHKGYGTPEHLEALRCTAPAATTAGSSPGGGHDDAGAGRRRHRHPAVTVVVSASNPQFKALRLLAQDSTAWRKQGRIWLEGDHLCRAALQRGVQPQLAVYPVLPARASPAGGGKDWCWPTRCSGRSAAWNRRPHGLRHPIPAPRRSTPMHPPWSSTGCRMPATWAPSCAAPAPSGSGRSWR
jgi:ribonuclease HII